MPRNGHSAEDKGKVLASFVSGNVSSAQRGSDDILFLFAWPIVPFAAFSDIQWQKGNLFHGALDVCHALARNK